MEVWRHEFDAAAEAIRAAWPAGGTHPNEASHAEPVWPEVLWGDQCAASSFEALSKCPSFSKAALVLKHCEVISKLHG